jgi:hypothetical protein
VLRSRRRSSGVVSPFSERLLNEGLALLFEFRHFLTVFVVVRERGVHISYVEVVHRGDLLGGEAPLFDEGSEPTDAHAPALHPWLPVEHVVRLHNAGDSLRYITGSYCTR